MCVSSAPAHFSGTIDYVGFLGNGQDRHVLGYQNTAQNRASGPNSMLLHLPAVELTQANFVDMRGCKNALKDIKTAATPVTRAMSFGSRGMGGVSVFTHDIYTVVVASEASRITEALEQVPAHQRPNISQELLNFYESAYGWPVALCCFSNRDAKSAAPLVIQYEPRDPSTLFAPGLDCHTGDVPDLRAHVETDHYFVMGTDRDVGEEVRYTDQIPTEVARFLPTHVVGRPFNRPEINGDFTIPLLAAQGGYLDQIQRTPPPLMTVF